MYVPFFKEKTDSSKQKSTIEFNYFTADNLTDGLLDKINNQNIDSVLDQNLIVTRFLSILVLIPAFIISGFISFLLIGLVYDLDYSLYYFTWTDYDMIRKALYIIIIPYFTLRIRYNYF